MNEPLPGQKTNIAAALFVVLQALAASGVVGTDVTEPVSQLLAAVMAVTLALKARRAGKGV